MTKQKNAIELDEVLKKLKPFGKYTVYNYALVIFPCFLAGFFASAYNFEAIDIDYRCRVPDCEILDNSDWLNYAIPKEKGELSKCKVYHYNNNTTDKCSIDAFNTEIIEECDSYVYSEEDSVVKDFDLGCQNWKRTLIGTIHNSGYFVALPLTGLISDRYGRTTALSITSLMNGVLGITRSFSTSYNMMVVLEFLESALGAGHYTTSFVMAMELVVPRGRVFGNTLINFVYVIGILILTMLAWWLQNWRRLVIIIFAPAFVPAVYFIFLKESPRWLISKGRHEEAVDIIRNAAKMNKVDISEDMLNAINNENLKKDIVEAEGKKKFSLFWQVIKSKIIMTRLAVCSFMWMSGTFIYYGLSINSVSLAGNKYLNFLVVAFMELPANLMVLLLLDRLGRKRIITTTFLLSGFLCIGLSLLPKDHGRWLFVLYLSGKFFSTMTYSSIYVYVSEVFPTNVRQTLLSVCSTMGRFGTTLAPLTPLLSFYYENLPAIFFGSVAIIASILTLILPETIDLALPDTIEEAERLSKRGYNKNSA